MSPSSSAPAAPRLLYVEDETEIAAILIELLGDEYRIDHATSAEEGLRLALGRRYDVMVVDRRLPGLSGVELIDAVRTARIATPTLMLTALGSIEDRVSGLDAGADDYLLKPFDVDELRARLRALRRGRIALTQAETELLELLTSSPEHVFTRDEILDSVFPGGSATTVDTYVHYIRRKSTPEIIETVRARGYRSGEPR